MLLSFLSVPSCPSLLFSSPSSASHFTPPPPLLTVSQFPVSLTTGCSLSLSVSSLPLIMPLFVLMLHIVVCLSSLSTQILPNPSLPPPHSLYLPHFPIFFLYPPPTHPSYPFPRLSFLLSYSSSSTPFLLILFLLGIFLSSALPRLPSVFHFSSPFTLILLFFLLFFFLLQHPACFTNSFHWFWMLFYFPC